MVFIVLLFPLAYLAMTMVMDAVEDWLSSRPARTGRRGLAGAARARHAGAGTVWAADEAVASPLPLPLPLAAAPADEHLPVPAQYRPAAVRAAGWS